MRHTNLLAMALESKGFSPQSPRTSYYESQMHRIDYVVFSVLGIVLAGLLYIRLGLGLGAIMPGRM
jgi:energy-coupling factor transporter transmembrane protein EcfT